MHFTPMFQSLLDLDPFMISNHFDLFIISTFFMNLLFNKKNFPSQK